MGSSGTDKFSDVHGMSTPKGNGGSAQSKDGSAKNQDQCDETINTTLEEVERCTYYLQHNAPPPNDTHIKISIQGRITVETDTGEVIGYLPTKYSYLAGCMNAGLSYGGIVTSSSNLPVVTVHVYISQSAI